MIIYEEHIDKPFPNGESLKDVEIRIKSFIEFLKENYNGKVVGIVAHRAPQLAFAVHKFNGADTFIKGFLYSYLLWNVVNWWDAIFIDCIWFCHSKKAVIPGTEGMKEYKDYLFHINGSLKGMLFGIPACLLVGVLVLLF